MEGEDLAQTRWIDGAIVRFGGKGFGIGDQMEFRLDWCCYPTVVVLVDWWFSKLEIGWSSSMSGSEVEA